MRFLIGLLLGVILGAVLTILATGNAGRALQEQIREQTERGDRSSGDEATARWGRAPLCLRHLPPLRGGRWDLA